MEVKDNDLGTRLFNEYIYKTSATLKLVVVRCTFTYWRKNISTAGSMLNLSGNNTSAPHQCRHSTMITLMGRFFFDYFHLSLQGAWIINERKVVSRKESVWRQIFLTAEYFHFSANINGMIDANSIQIINRRPSYEKHIMSFNTVHHPLSFHIF